MSKNIKISDITNTSILLNGEMNDSGIKIGDDFLLFNVEEEENEEDEEIEEELVN